MNRLYPAEFVYSTVFLKGRAQTGMTAEDSSTVRARHRQPVKPENNNSYNSYKEEEDTAEAVTAASAEAKAADKPIDPFTNTLSWSALTTKQKVALVVGSLTLSPVRMFLFLLFYGIAYLICCLGLIGVSQDELDSKLLTGFRSRMQETVKAILRLLIKILGFTDYQVTGVQASPAEAPILVAAPHSSCMDVIPVVHSESRPVAKKGMLGPVGKFMQLTIVNRSSKESRHLALEKIQKRAEQTQEGLFPQTIIFPEGTCTNAKALIKFKVGAFYAGAPVQPVLVRPCWVRGKDGKYQRSGVDTQTWTWNQNLNLFCLYWLTMAQPTNAFEIEYLPVYHPSEEEKADPELFGANVRAVMASRLKVPVMDVSYTSYVKEQAAK